MISALCIRRPVMTILLMVSILAAAFSPFGNCLSPPCPASISRRSRSRRPCPARVRRRWASSVASILEKQFSTIAGVTSMTSTSSLGATSIVIQFDLSRNIDGAALDVQSAISTAQRRLPADLTTPPSFRKVNPADQPVVFLTLSSKTARLSDVDRLAQTRILPTISTLPGVAQVQILGSQKYAVRITAPTSTSSPSAGLPWPTCRTPSAAPIRAARWELSHRGRSTRSLMRPGR